MSNPESSRSAKTPQPPQERLRALAWEAALRRHERHADADGYGCMAGHRLRFKECDHPDCVLVRAAASAPHPPPAEIVQQPWTWTLALRMQSLLMLAMRGPDGCSKENGAKVLLRELRSLVLVPAFPGRPDSFMGTQTGKTDWDVVETFAEYHDEYPHHWVVHFIHACEVVGQFHPDNELRTFWFNVYDRLCHAMHMRPEPIDALTDRLGPMPELRAVSAPAPHPPQLKTIYSLPDNKLLAHFYDYGYYERVVKALTAASADARPSPQLPQQETTNGHEDRTHLRDERGSTGSGRSGIRSGAPDGSRAREAGDVGARDIQQRPVQESHVSSESDRPTRVPETVGGAAPLGSAQPRPETKMPDDDQAARVDGSRLLEGTGSTAASNKLIREILGRMRGRQARWQHSHGSCDVIYANAVDDWADEIEAEVVELERQLAVGIAGTYAK